MNRYFLTLFAFLAACAETAHDNIPELPCAEGEFKRASSQEGRTTICVPWSLCGDSEYETTAPTDQRDRECSPLTVCQAGEYVQSPASKISDRTCESCSLGKDFSDTENAASCTPTSTCEDGAYVSEKATLTQDTACGKCAADVTVAMGTCLECDGIDTCTLAACAPGFVDQGGACIAAGTPPNALCDADSTTCTCDEGFYGKIVWDDSGEVWSGTCQPWTVCEAGEFIAQAGTAESDRTCEACEQGVNFSNQTNAESCVAVTDCEAGEKVGVKATTSSDFECIGCSEGTFSLEANAAECLPWSTCSAGTYIAKAGTSSADQACAACSLGEGFTADENMGTCTNVTVCEPGLYVLKQATLTSDITCDACPIGTFSDAPGSLSCTPWTPCLPGAFISEAGTSVTDQACDTCKEGLNFSSSEDAQACDPVTPCPAGTYVSQEATLILDAVCSPCEEGTFSAAENALGCTPWSNCPSGSSVSQDGTSTSDRICVECVLGEGFTTGQNSNSCTPVSECKVGNFIAEPATQSADVVCEACPAQTYADTENSLACAPWTECSIGEYVLVPGSDATDRLCEPCTDGADFSVTTNAPNCTPLTECAEDEVEIIQPTVDQDRVCDTLVIALSAEQPQAFESGEVPVTLLLSLSAPSPNEFEVTLTHQGSATHEEDYRLFFEDVEVDSSFTVPAGKSEVSLVLKPVPSAGLEVTESVTVALSPLPHYRIEGGSASAHIIISEYGPSPGDVYVVAPNGDDSNPGSEENPFATIAHGVLQLSAGDTLFIKDGTYTNKGFTEDHGPTGEETLNNPLVAQIKASGTADKWITIAAYPDGNQIRPKLRFDGMGGIEIKPGVSHLVIEGLEIEGPNASIQQEWAHAHRWSKENFYKGRGIFTWGPVNNIVVRNCNVHHSPGSGIRFNKGDYILVENNIVSNTTWWSSSAESAIVIATAEHIDTKDVVKFLYSGNVVYNNWNVLEFCSTPLKDSVEDTYGNCDYYTGGIIDGQGLYVTRNNETYLHGRMRFENNIAYNNGFGGVVYHKTDRGELANNLVFMNGAYPGLTKYSGLTVNTSDDLTIVNNILWAREPGEYGMKNNGNASNVTAKNNYVVGKSQFGDPGDNTVLSFEEAPDLDQFFLGASDISSAAPDPYATEGETSPSKIDALVQGFALNFALVATAVPLIEAGTSDFAPSTDIKQVPRPQGEAVDIGPYEFGGIGTCEQSIYEFLTQDAMQMPTKNTEGYVPPEPDAQALLGDALGALFDSQWVLASVEAGLAGYSLCQGAGEESGLILGEPMDVDSGHARFVWRIDPERGMLLSAPHPLSDAGTLAQTTILFQELGARILVISGTHRCANAAESACDGTTSTCGGNKSPFKESDMAHVTDSMFQAVHERFTDVFPDDWVVSVSGMGLEGISLSSGKFGDIEPSTAVARTFSAFIAAYPDAYITTCNTFEGALYEQRLCGTNNMQGRYTNGSPYPCQEPAVINTGRFVHLEQSKPFREDPAGVAEVLKSAWDAP